MAPTQGPAVPRAARAQAFVVPALRQEREGRGTRRVRTAQQDQKPGPPDQAALFMEACRPKEETGTRGLHARTRSITARNQFSTTKPHPLRTTVPTGFPPSFQR